jgi:hypothetical protein
VSTEPETGATGAVPSPPENLAALAGQQPFSASATAPAADDSTRAASPDLPGAVLAAATAPGSPPEVLPDPAPSGHPAADEAAAGPGGQQEPPARVSLRELGARIAVPLKGAAVPSWPDLMQRAAADQEPWAAIVESLIEAGSAEMRARQWRVWFGTEAPAAAA